MCDLISPFVCHDAITHGMAESKLSCMANNEIKDHTKSPASVHLSTLPADEDQEEYTKSLFVILPTVRLTVFLLLNQSVFLSLQNSNIFKSSRVNKVMLMSVLKFYDLQGTVTSQTVSYC